MAVRLSGLEEAMRIRREYERQWGSIYVISFQSRELIIPPSPLSNGITTTDHSPVYVTYAIIDTFLGGWEEKNEQWGSGGSNTSRRPQQAANDYNQRQSHHKYPRKSKTSYEEVYGHAFAFPRSSAVPETIIDKRKLEGLVIYPKIPISYNP
uniref:Uncharacterized protein n=1 Tax=Lactuca sativa TaxID=4236 RepID=A0A9R1WFU3_LACSA|nr:hypothetical protein LSAT_V11C200084680 [Lactuca sativa]